MSDPTQFVVNLSIAHRLLHHEGIMGTGRDFMTNVPCSLHSYSDRFKRSYVMQLFDGVEADFVTKKFNSIAKSAHSTSLPNLIRPAFITSRKANKSSFQFTIFYDTQGIGELSLSQLIEAKRLTNQKFEADELVAFFWQMADFFLLSGKSNSEYFNICPQNIYCKIQGFYGYNFFISNFGRVAKNKKYHNPSDIFHIGQKTHQTALSAALFTLGIVLLEMASMTSSQNLYDQAGHLNQKALSKRIEGVKIINDKMIGTVIRQLLEINQSKRLKISDIYKNEQWLKLRKVTYYQSKADFFQYRSFQGLVQYDKKTSIGQALDKDLAMLRGTFNTGIFEGRGVRENGVHLQAGIFYTGQLTQGQSIKKNSHIDVGKFKGGVIQQGLRIFLNIENSSKQGRGLAGFVGDFVEGEPQKGRRIYSDGSEEQK